MKKHSTVAPDRPRFVAEAEGRIRATGERLTQPRIAVLATLLAANHAVSHQDIATALASHSSIDRVTVYRVLDWLVDVAIAHRIAGDDRVWRFMLNPAQSEPGADARQTVHQQHAHFICERCGQTFCLNDTLNDATRFNFKLPPGFKPSEIDLKFRGACAHCA